MKKYDEQVKAALDFYEKAYIVLTDREKQDIEVADFGKDMVKEFDLQLIAYVNTEKVCDKEMVLFPRHTCPEHKHVPTNGMSGKKTFGYRYGEVYLYVAGEKNTNTIKVKLPPNDITVFHKIILKPGEQYTIIPEMLHRFQTRPDGAVISKFSTLSTEKPMYLLIIGKLIANS